MKASVEKQALIDEAALNGFEVTSKQIDRWRTDKLLPPPAKTSAGRGRGVRRPAPEGSARQLMRLQYFLSEDRSLHRAAFRLWIEGYLVPLERVRIALRSLVLDPKRLMEMPQEMLAGEVEKYSEHIRTRKKIPERVKKMADDGRLPTLFSSLLSMGLGRPIDPDDRAALGARFEEYAGLDRARSDHWEGKSPWLTSDAETELDNVAKLLPAMRPQLADDATDEEYAKARLGFLGWDKMRRCTELLETLHGKNVFGLGMLTQPPTGARPTESDPFLFLGLLAFCRLEPSLLDNMITAGETLETSLETLRAQVMSKQRSQQTEQ